MVKITITSYAGLYHKEYSLRNTLIDHNLTASKVEKTLMLERYRRQFIKTHS